jgi:CRP-like cAMP-binding protein
MPCDPATWAEVELFEHLGEEERRRLADAVDLRRLEPGEFLFRAGEPGESLYIVRSGEVELFVRDNAGQKIPLTIACANQIFGELALLDRGPRTATAQALSETELLELDREDLLMLFSNTPSAALRLLAGMGHMTRKADELIRTRISRNANEEAVVQATPLQRVADGIAWFSGSMLFLFLNAAWFLIWIVLNTTSLGTPAMEPSPIGLLNIIL